MYQTVAEVAKRLNCTEQRVRQIITSGQLRSERKGRIWLIKEEEIRKYVDAKFMPNDGDNMRNAPMEKSNKLIALSFFSGALGLDIGLERAGIETILACEFDKDAKQTIRANKPNIALIGDLLNYTSSEILQYAGINKADVDVIVGGPPCQAFSTAGKRRGFEDARGNVFLKYIDVIGEIKPKYFVIENVRGLMSSQFGLDDNLLLELGLSTKVKNLAGSSLYYVIKKLESLGYAVNFNLYNSAYFGTPQARERVVIIGTTAGTPVPFLVPTHSENAQFGLKPWNTLRDAIGGRDSTNDEHVNFSNRQRTYLSMLKEGENWTKLPENLKEEAMGKAYHLGGGKTGFYRRLAWNKPAPTLVTHPGMPATALCHPDITRPLSVEEYARVQQFPDDWKFMGSLLSRYKQIGNAVPTGVGQAIGKAIVDHHLGITKDFEVGPLYSRYKGTAMSEWMTEFERKLKAEHVNVQLKLM
jgi:DNA (cytosine-5)-methyltransferase 1